MIISNVQTGNGVTAFSGMLAAPLGDETCPLTGAVIDRAQVQYSDGIEDRTAYLPSIVFIRGQCKNMMIVMELFGMPSGKILLNGRAALIAPDNSRSYEPVALSRP